MKTSVLRVTVIAGMLLLIFINPALSATERRIALVIGNGAYKLAPLRNPVNDAGDIADALGKLGFSVILKTNATQRTMEESIHTFGNQLRSGGVGLFYFAGHGLQVKGRNYLIPIGADIRGESDVKYESVDAGRVLGKMEDAGNSLNVIILDACRNNPFARSFRATDRGLAKMDAPTGSILAYATAPGSVASDGPGRNGLYTSALLKHMMTSGVKIEDVFKQVRIDVVNDSGKKQVPWESSSLTGDFYFNTDRGITVVKQKKLAVEAEKLSPTIPKSQQTTMEMELAFWQSIQNSKNPASFKAYLEQFPQGTFAALAKVKINEHEKKKIEGGQKRPEAEKTKIVKKETPNIGAIEPSVTKPEAISQPPKEKAKIGSKIEKPKEKTVVASISPDVSKSEIITKDGRFVKYANGIVLDKKTGLEWFTGPDKDTTENEAKSWVESLKVDGGGWRMPTRDDVETLYEKGVGKRNMTPLLKISGWSVWYVDKKYSSSGWYLYFNFGEDFGFITRSDSYGKRAFAVRFRKSGKTEYKKAVKEVPKYASLSPSVTEAKIVARDAHYEKYANGIVYDTQTGLEWYPGPEKEREWNKAVLWTKSLDIDGGGWRLPTIEELRELYQDGVGSRNMTPLIVMSGW